MEIFPFSLLVDGIRMIMLSNRYHSMGTKKQKFVSQEEVLSWKH
jgi:hypothetical protein